MTSTQASRSTLTMLLDHVTPVVPDGSEAMTVEVDLPPGDPGAAPHRHSGPVFGYVVEGAIVFELEGEPERIIRAGEAFWEPGGDVIHYQAANQLADARSRFIAVMLGRPGEPMLTFVDAAELEERRHLRAAR
ncbi:cupin domain-containing protein [Pseudonocardia sp. TRM90224]|uniref:cupin domain-containing protein n=1 Tax=Pseudonocardia sp. TRM90224 TaxID=2812678 RepID=UPI001E3D9583|nr:cupin domain-containing protein [Pseudonocardia sp. TRM90224]